MSKTIRFSKASSVNKKTRTSISYTESINSLFNQLDINQDGSITIEDLNYFRSNKINKKYPLLEQYKDKHNEEIDLLGIERKIFEKEFDLPQLFSNFKISLQLCRNMISLYGTKLENLSQSVVKHLNEVDFKNTFLIANITTNKNDYSKPKLSFLYSIKNWKEIITIESLNFKFKLEDHFEYLFLNNNHEFFLELENENKSLVCNLGYYDTMSEPEKEKMQKIKTNLLTLQSKMNRSKKELNYYNEILEGVNSNNLPSKENTFLTYLNKLLLINSVDEDESVLNPNDNSFMSSKSSSKNIFRCKIMSKEENANLSSSFSKSFSTSNIINPVPLIINDRRVEDTNDNKYFGKNVDFESVTEEPTAGVDEKLKKIINIYKSNGEVKSISNKGSLRCLLNMAIQSTYVFSGTKDKFDVCREYKKSISQG